MTTVSQKSQYTTDGRFAFVIRQTFGPQRTPMFTPELQKMLVSPAATVHSFNGFQQLVSPYVTLQYRNELARAFMLSLKNNDWNREESEAAVPVVDWLLGMKKGQVGGYIKIVRPMVELACQKLVLPLEQKKAWKKLVAEKPRICPRGIGGQAPNAIPRPVLRGAHFHD